MGLVISVRVGESFYVEHADARVRVTVIKYSGCVVRLRVSAPAGVSVYMGGRGDTVRCGGETLVDIGVGWWFVVRFAEHSATIAFASRSEWDGVQVSEGKFKVTAPRAVSIHRGQSRPWVDKAEGE